MDAVQQANSGHPGMPMGMADIAEVLWNDFLPPQPGATRPGPIATASSCPTATARCCCTPWLHLTGYPLSMDEIRRFRQLGSRTPGHPERDLAIGIETTTGPLGQGLANAVGMALAEKILAAHFNRPGLPIVDHHTYVFLGDGCMMEGISHEACSLAGMLQLGKLICLYDDNGISIDGDVEGWFRDDTPARFRAYGWQVIAGRGRPRSAGGARRTAGGPPEHRAADADLLQDHHRLRRPQPAGHRGDARLAARRRRGRRRPRDPRVDGAAVCRSRRRSATAWDAREKGERLEKRVAAAVR